MLRTGGMVALSVGALISAGTMNLAVLNEGPAGPGNLVLRAAAGTTTSTTAAAHHTVRLAAAEQTTSTTAARRHHLLTRSTDPSSTTTNAPTTTTGAPKHEPPTTTTTQPPTTTTTQPPNNPNVGRLFVVRDAGRVHVRWLTKKTISATADPNPGWTLPHNQKQGPDVTLRFSSKTELVVWHAWVEAHTIKAWIRIYNLATGSAVATTGGTIDASGGTASIGISAQVH